MTHVRATEALPDNVSQPRSPPSSGGLLGINKYICSPESNLAYLDYNERTVTSSKQIMIDPPHQTL